MDVCEKSVSLNDETVSVLKVNSVDIASEEFHVLHREISKHIHQILAECQEDTICGSCRIGDQIIAIYNDCAPLKNARC